MNEGKSKTASSYSGWQFLKDALEAGKAEQARIVEAAKECDHKGHYRLVNGMYVAIRICTGCGKSWRMPTSGEYPDEMPDAIWEEIDEPAKWASPVLPDYED